jgi:protein-disulfide isomerase
MSAATSIRPSGSSAPARLPARLAGAAVLALALLGACTRLGLLSVPLARDEPAQGRADAPLTLLEFTDYQCPYCRRFHTETWPRLQQEFVERGQLRFIVRDLPLEFHPGAEPAAEAANCAGEQGKFWPMHDALLDGEVQLSAAGVLEAGRKLGLDMQFFEACVHRGKYRDDIRRNAELARSLGLNGTPAFVLGRVRDGVLHGEPIKGAVPFEAFAQEIREQLAAP